MTANQYILLNGPLGVGKSTLAEVLMERIEGCVMLDGDALVAMNPEPDDPTEAVHSAIVDLARLRQDEGYRHFVISHLWSHAEELEDLERRLHALGECEVVAFLLWLPIEENLRRIERRQRARAIDEREFELATVHRERALLAEQPEGSIGERLDASPGVETLATSLMEKIGIGRDSARRKESR